MLKHVLLLLLFTMSWDQLYSQSKKVDIQLQTDGDLLLSRAQGEAKVTTNKKNNQDNDRLIKQYGETEEVKVFSNASEAKAGKKHKSLEVKVPDQWQATLRSQHGNITLSNLNASLMGQMQSGTLTLTNVKGEVEMVNEAGDIVATGVEAEGILVARNGNIRLNDVTGPLTTFAPKGKISVSIGTAYYQKRATPLDIQLKEAELILTTVPHGGSIQLGRGSITASNVAKPLTIQADSASVSVRGVAASLAVRNRGSVNVYLLPFAKKEENQSVLLEVERGDLTLELAKGFEGNLQIQLTETNPVATEALISSGMTLRKDNIVENSSEDGKMKIRESFYSAHIGKSGPSVVVHVTNGKVILK